MDFLNDAEINDNEEEYDSSINVTGIFSYEKDTPIEKWLLNSVESLVTSTLDLPSDWVQVIDINKTSKWPLFTSLATDRIEKERLNIPVTAFQFWEQKISKICLMK